MNMPFMSNFELPEAVDFDVVFEPTKFKGKKYVINQRNGEYIGIVGDTFKCASHPHFFTSVMQTMAEQLSEHEIDGAEIHWKTANHGGWVMMDVTLPNTKVNVITAEHTTEIARRIIALHGVDGSCSNIILFGAIDFFCENGMVIGDYDTIKRKNTSKFNIDDLIAQLRQSRIYFDDQVKRLQIWADTPLDTESVENMLHKMLQPRSKAERMFALYNEAAHVRGHNVFALYSAFTNYASHTDVRNRLDTKAIIMFERELEVMKWINDSEFTRLANERRRH